MLPRGGIWFRALNVSHHAQDLYFPLYPSDPSLSDRNWQRVVSRLKKVELLLDSSNSLISLLKPLSFISHISTVSMALMALLSMFACLRFRSTGEQNLRERAV
jgi:hypothetical protein